MILHNEIGVVVGRDELLPEIFNEVKKGKHILLVGDVGIGKSTALESLYEAFTAKGGKSILVTQTNPMKGCVEDMIEELHRNHDLELYEYETEHLKPSMEWRKLKRMLQRMVVKDSSSIVLRSLQDAAKKGSPPKKYVVFLDHLEKITPTQEAFFTALSHHTVLVGATDEKKASKHLKKVWWIFKEIQVPALDDAEIREIAGRYIDKTGLLVEDRELLLTTIAKESRGNSLACANILAEYRGEKCISKAHIREFHGQAGVQYVDLTPLLLIVIVIGVATRYLALGMDDRTLYMLAGIAYAGFYILRFFMYKFSRGSG